MVSDYGAAFREAFPATETGPYAGDAGRLEDLLGAMESAELTGVVKTDRPLIMNFCDLARANASARLSRALEEDG